LIHNWTQPEFVEFVERIENEVEKLDLQEGSEAWTRAEEASNFPSLASMPPQLIETRVSFADVQVQLATRTEFLAQYDGVGSNESVSVFSVCRAGTVPPSVRCGKD